MMDFSSENDIYSEKKAISNYHMILKPSDNLGGLFLGDLKISQDLNRLKQLERKVILDMAGLNYSYRKEHNIICQSIKAEDEPDFDLRVHFKGCFDFIHEHRVKGENVLVHCRVGKSRSATIVIGYLMHSQKMDFQTAFQFVKEIRSIAQPNEGFVEQLKKLEQSLKFEEEILEE